MGLGDPNQSEPPLAARQAALNNFVPIIKVFHDGYVPLSHPDTMGVASVFVWDQMRKKYKFTRAILYDKRRHMGEGPEWICYNWRGAPIFSNESVEKTA